MDKTVLEWCKARHLSRSTYHKLKNLGLGPKELEIPGTRIKRITPVADAEWEARMAELAKSETARLEAERRRELATIAGQIAAESPRHVSRRGARSTPTPRRRWP
jgi:hypothetical protein